MLGIVVAAVMFAVYVLFLKKDKVESLYRAAGLMFFWYAVTGVINLIRILMLGLTQIEPTQLLMLALIMAMPIGGAWLLKESCRGATSLNGLDSSKFYLGAGIIAAYTALIFLL